MILDLIDLNKSDIKYIIHNFPDGEKHIELLVEENFFNKVKEDLIIIDILCRITSYEDMFILKQIDDIFRTNNIESIITITYLLSQRMDRAMSKTRACSLDIVLSDLNNLSSNKVTVVSPHNINKIYYNMMDYFLKEIYIVDNILTRNLDENFVILFPDKGAYNRYSDYFPYDEYRNYETAFAEKVRDEDSNIISYKLKDEDNLDFTNKNVIVIDDLIDGGKTFRELSKLIPNTAKSKTLVVCHAVQEEGLLNTSKYYDTIYISNSYKDWKNMENIIVYSVI